jgi:hypothetical protein
VILHSLEPLKTITWKWLNFFFVIRYQGRRYRWSYCTPSSNIWSTTENGEASWSLTEILILISLYAAEKGRLVIVKLLVSYYTCMYENSSNNSCKEKSI